MLCTCTVRRSLDSQFLPARRYAGAVDMFLSAHVPVTCRSCVKMDARIALYFCLQVFLDLCYAVFSGQK